MSYPLPTSDESQAEQNRRTCCYPSPVFPPSPRPGLDLYRPLFFCIAGERAHSSYPDRVHWLQVSTALSAVYPNQELQSIIGGLSHIRNRYGNVFCVVAQKKCVTFK